MFSGLALPDLAGFLANAVLARKCNALEQGAATSMPAGPRTSQLYCYCSSALCVQELSDPPTSYRASNSSNLSVRGAKQQYSIAFSAVSLPKEALYRDLLSLACLVSSPGLHSTLRSYQLRVGFLRARRQAPVSGILCVMEGASAVEEAPLSKNQQKKRAKAERYALAGMSLATLSTARQTCWFEYTPSCTAWACSVRPQLLTYL